MKRSAEVSRLTTQVRRELKLVTTKHKKLAMVCAELSASVANFGSLETVLK